VQEIIKVIRYIKKNIILKMTMTLSFFMLLSKVCLSFSFGVGIYKYISCFATPQQIKSLDVLLKTKNLILIILLLYVCIVYIIPYIYDLFISYITIEAASNTPNPTPSDPTDNNIKSSVNSGGDAIIMTTALAAGSKLAQKAPTIAAKAAIITGAVGLGALGIVTKNVTGNLSSDIGKSSIILFAFTNVSLKNTYDKEYTIILEYVYKMLDLSGNSVQDLLKIIDYLNNLQYVFLYFIIYFSIILSIDSSRIESFLNKILFEKIVIFFMRSVKLIKKSGKIYLIIFYILLSYNIYLSNHCYSYLYDNFDAICELHLSNKIN
jgi:hypothetical protein